MNFKKFKRLLSVALSASMLLSTNMTALATEISAPIQVESVAEQEIQEDVLPQGTEVKEATATEAGITQYVSEDGEIRYKANSLTDEATGDDTTGDNTAGDDTTTTPDEGVTENVATYNNTGYPTLEAAITAATSDTATGEKTITLSKDATLSGTQNLGSIKIETKGFTITIPANQTTELTGGTFINDQTMRGASQASDETAKKNHTILLVPENASLVINSGTYQTKGNAMLDIKGTATIKDGTFTSTLTSGDDFVPTDYRARYLFLVAGNLTMTGGTADVEAIGNSSTYGMYVIYAQKGTLVLGNENAAGPTLKGYVGAIGLNGTQGPVDLTIHSGTYTGTAAFGEDNQKYNSVLYLSAECSANIKGGEFTHKGATGTYNHVISVPYINKDGQTVNKSDLQISGGTFTGSGSIFYGLPATKDKCAGTVSVTGGKYKGDVAGLSGINYLPTGKVFADGTGDAVGHKVISDCTHANTPIYVPRETADCFKTGTNAHYKCEACGTGFGTSSKTPVLTEEQITIKKLNHDGEWVAPVPATCNADGYKGYYQCPICKNCYESMTDLVADDGTKGKPQADFKETSETVLHTYTQEDYTFDWGVEADAENGKVMTVDTISELTVAIETMTGKDQTPSSVSVTRTCSVCGIKQSTEDENSVLQVAVSAAAYDANAFQCTDGFRVVLTAEVTEQTPEIPEATTDAETDAVATDTFTVQILEADQHDYQYTATVDSNTLTDGNFVVGTSKVDITRTCKVTDCKEAAKTVKTGTILSKDGTELTVVCLTENNAELIARGEFDDNGTITTGEASFTASLQGAGHGEWTYHPYKAATCAADGEGNYAYYECGKCHGRFWDISDGSTKQSDKLSDEQIQIPALTHNFSIPKFEWADGTNTAAKVTFSCINGCGTNIVKNNVTVGEAQWDANASCTASSDIEYEVSVKFHKSYVTGSGADAVYDEAAASAPGSKEALYKGKLTKSAVKGHAFKATAAWQASTRTDTEHDIASDPVEVVLNCEDCNAIITIPATYDKEKDETTQGTVTATGIAAKDITITDITITAVTDINRGYVEPICTAGGTSVYDISVTCTTDDGKPAATYDKMDVNGKEEPLHVTTPTSALDHAYVITDAKDANGNLTNVYWANQSADPTKPTDVTVCLVCKNDKRHALVLTGEDEGVSLTKYEDGEPYVKKTCTENGTNAWAVSVTPVGSQTPITELTPAAELEGTATAEEDTPVGPAPAAQKIYVTKNNPATGHTYTNEGWVTKPYIDGTSKDIFYVSTCNSADCDGIGEDIGQTITGAGEDDIVWDKTEAAEGKTGKTIRKIRGTVSVQASKEPTCTEKGTGTTTVTSDIKINGTALPAMQPLTGELPAKGHEWSKTVTWKEWTDNKTTANVTIGTTETPVTVPVYKIAAERGCTVCDTKDACEGIVTAGEPVKNSYGSYIEVNVTAHRSATCEEAGETSYQASFFGKSNSQKEETPVKVGAASDKTARPAKLGHDFSTEATIDWNDPENGLQEEKLLDANGNPVISGNGNQIYTGNFTVKAVRECSRCNGTEDVPVNVTTKGQCGSTDETANTITHTAAIDETYEASDGKTVTIKEGEAICTKEYAEHKVNRISASTSSQCDEPSYITHYHCSNCGNNYKNAQAITPIEVSFDIQGHLYGEPVFDWTAEGRSANATFTCTRCYNEDSTENAKDAKLVYTAEIGPQYIDIPSKCTTWAQMAENQGKDGRGTAYYAVNVIFTEDTLPKGLTELSYEDELEVRLPLGGHSFKVDTADQKEKCEYCGTLKEESVEVIYKTDTGITLRTDIYTKTTTEITAPPAAPNQGALQFDQWKVNGQALEAGKTLQETIIGLLKNGGTITVTACYKEPEVKTATVTVEYSGLPEELKKDPVTATVNIGSTYEATAEEGPLDTVNKKWYFSHWLSVQEDADGTDVEVILGTGTKYDIYIQSAAPVTVYAVYTENKPQEAAPTIAMTNQYRSVVEGKNRVSFTATMNIPEGYTMVESGILYTTNAALATKEQMVLGTTGVAKSMMNGTKANTFTANVSDPNRVVYARGYLRYKNNATNVEEVIYAENIASGSYNSLPDLAVSAQAK